MGKILPTVLSELRQSRPGPDSDGPYVEPFAASEATWRTILAEARAALHLPQVFVCPPNDFTGAEHDELQLTLREFGRPFVRLIDAGRVELYERWSRDRPAEVGPVTTPGGRRPAPELAPGAAADDAPAPRLSG